MVKCSLRRLRFLFSPSFSTCTSSTCARVSCRDRLFVVSGKGSFGLLRTKKVGTASRLDDNLHTAYFIFIAGSILAVNLVCPKPYLIYATETKTIDPTELKIGGAQRKVKDKNVGYARCREKEKVELKLPHLWNPHKIKQDDLSRCKNGANNHSRRIDGVKRSANLPTAPFLRELRADKERSKETLMKNTSLLLTMS
ncbi:hypothetical protein [Phocaeicola oris]|uniref:hypothetical protein n=1 Tax=Phocaeicola oris TaxID=2896850 RepID=UPI00234F0A16|nr:hypothetical protein [Phocaeicola oris]MCE2615833.1 hypothetical protein [Phocaeicola oris]